MSTQPDPPSSAQLARWPAKMDKRRDGWRIRLLALPVEATGPDFESALRSVQAALNAWIESRLNAGESVTPPAEQRSDLLVTPTARLQAALLFVWASEDVRTSEMERRLRTSWKRVNELRSGCNATLDRVEAAAAAVGKTLVVGYVEHPECQS